MKQFTILGTEGLQMQPNELAHYYQDAFPDPYKSDVFTLNKETFTQSEILKFQTEEYWEDFLSEDKVMNYINKKIRTIKQVALRGEILKADKKNTSFIKLLDVLVKQDKEEIPVTHYSHFHLPRFTQYDSKSRPQIEKILSRIEIDD